MKTSGKHSRKNLLEKQQESTLWLTDDGDTDAEDDDNSFCKSLMMSDDDWDFRVDVSSDFSAKYSPTFFNTALT